MNVDMKVIGSIVGEEEKKINVIFAAARAFNILESADMTGKTMDGDDAIMCAKRALASGFFGLSEIEI